MPTYPLVFHASPDQTIAWRDGTPVAVRTFLAEVARLAAALPAGGHVFNACTDRYRFTVGLCATLVAGKISLLPASQTPETVRQLAAFAPDVFCLHDAPDCAIELPRFRFPEPLPSAGTDAPVDVPQIDASRVMAYIFTSGSTGTPVPHRKTWGALVQGVRASATRLGLLDAHACTLVGTVPPQHMYGFESTVLLALVGGLAFSNRLPFYPADIRAALEAVPQPRVLVTSPIHLRALLSSDHALPPAALVLSATAPLIEIYGSTETGQIATRRTAQGATWHLQPGIRLEARAGTPEEDGPVTWASGAHLDAPVPMGDTLEPVDDTHFLLHGRKADLINIAGKRTSLAYLNHQLNAISGVEDGVFFMPSARDNGGEALTRLAALVVAPGLAAADLLHALRERIDAAFLPRPLLFVDALPRNATGKLPRDVLAALVAQHGRHDDDARKPVPITFTIPANHPALPGHFPGHPIVPGVVLLDQAIRRIGVALNRSFDACRLSSAKFLSPAAPGVPLALAFEATASGAIRFTVSAGEREVASGVLAQQEAARP
ncbi:AMP-binding protein [Ralstonia syzygii]|uniref:AMP-binding protein n=1 Tax=Ralstonia syzygii TaxID=28097 RepID=UPI0018D15485|nr:AMP-binding protein [Ralstonia syzygii]